MIPIEIFIIVVVILLSLNYFSLKYGEKRSIDQFMEALFVAGLMGKVDAFKNYNRFAKPNGSVFVGDSITQDYNVYEYFPDKQVYNRGIGGDTSEGVLQRLNESIFDLKPKNVFLNIGTNDFERLNDGITGTYKRIVEIIEKIRSFDSNINIYIISVYPVNPNVDRKTVGSRNNKEIKELNDMLSKIEGITYVDLFNRLIEDGNLAKSFTIEGLHLNQKGYDIITKELSKYI
jgi:lysophospholipase L1-like esterase